MPPLRGPPWRRPPRRGKVLECAFVGSFLLFGSIMLLLLANEGPDSPPSYRDPKLAIREDASALLTRQGEGKNLPQLISEGVHNLRTQRQLPDARQQRRMEQAVDAVLTKQVHMRGKVGDLLDSIQLPTLPRTLELRERRRRYKTAVDSLTDPSAELPNTHGLDHSRISLVLCTWTGDAEGFPRVPMLVSSISTFMNPLSLHTLYFVVPRADVSTFQQLIATGFNLPHRPRFSMSIVVDEDIESMGKEEYRKLLPSGELKENGGRGVNYRLQMLLKLGISRIVQTTYYITLDNDVFLKRPTEFFDLVPFGKAVVQGKEDSRHRQSWWDASCALVQDAMCQRLVASSEFQIGVTPAILSTALTRELLQYLEDTYPGPHGREPWDVVMFRSLHHPVMRDWTEYTVYWAYGYRRRVLGRLHTLMPDRRLYDTSGFEWNSFGQYNVEKVFNDNSTFFGVVQSINGAPSPDVIKAISPYLRLPRG